MRSYLPSILLVSFLIRLLVTGASIGDAIVIIALSALFAGWYWLETKKEPVPNAEIKNKIVELEEQLKLTKDKINSVALASSFKR
jgi:uncharacterized membrane protein YfbV (UPF0208 family)